MLYPQNGGRIVAIDTVTPLRPMYRASNSTGIIYGTLRGLYGVRGTNSDDMAPLPLSHVHTVAAGGRVSHRCGFCRGGFNRIIHHHESWIECTSASAVAFWHGRRSKTHACLLVFTGRVRGESSAIGRVRLSASFTLSCQNQLIFDPDFCKQTGHEGWLGSRVVSVLESGAEGPGFKSQPWRCRVTVLGKLFTPIVPLFTKQRNW